MSQTASRGGQLALDLPVEPDYRTESFAVTEVNASALALVNRWPDWRQGHLLLMGPPASGKTHLAHIWADRSQAETMHPLEISDRLKTMDTGQPIVIEDIDQGLDQDGLFHLLNRAAGEDGTTVLMTASGRLDDWSIQLPDLYSRLRAAETATLHKPDDALLRLVLEKLFRDRRTPLGHGVVSYLLPRMERSVDFARYLVNVLDREALSRQSAVTRQMAGEVLQELSDHQGQALDSEEGQS